MAGGLDAARTKERNALTPVMFLLALVICLVLAVAAVGWYEDGHHPCSNYDYWHYQAMQPQPNCAGIALIDGNTTHVYYAFSEHVWLLIFGISALGAVPVTLAWRRFAWK